MVRDDPWCARLVVGGLAVSAVAVVVGSVVLATQGRTMDATLTRLLSVTLDILAVLIDPEHQPRSNGA